MTLEPKRIYHRRRGDRRESIRIEISGGRFEVSNSKSETNSFLRSPYLRWFSLLRKNIGEDFRYDVEERKSRDDNRREPCGDVVDCAVGVLAHHLFVVDEAEDGYEQNGQEKSVDDLHVQQRVNQRKSWHHRY